MRGPVDLRFGARPLTARGPMPAGPAPTWVAYDSKVLRFFAYFVEAVPMYGHSEDVLRKCAICYYLEDGTLQARVEPYFPQSRAQNLTSCSIARISEPPRPP